MVAPRRSKKVHSIDLLPICGEIVWMKNDNDIEVPVLVRDILDIGSYGN